MSYDQNRQPGGLGHPEKEALQRFMVGAVSPIEARAVVSHLLRGCPACRRVTGKLWSFGEGRPRRAAAEARLAAPQAGACR